MARDVTPANQARLPPTLATTQPDPTKRRAFGIVVEETDGSTAASVTNRSTQRTVRLNIDNQIRKSSFSSMSMSTARMITTTTSRSRLPTVALTNLRTLKLMPTIVTNLKISPLLEAEVTNYQRHFVFRFQNQALLGLQLTLGHPGHYCLIDSVTSTDL
jgi:hypothetical protein